MSMGDQRVLQKIDLIGDFGGKDLFLVDGDSILAYFLFEESQENFLAPLQKVYNDEHQFIEESCPLYMVYLVEKFLHNLQQKGARFHVVFFWIHGQALCRTDYRLEAYREIIRSHLSLNTAHKVFNFNNWEDDSNWKSYLQYYRPLFVMTYGSLSAEQLKLSQELQNFNMLNHLFEVHCKERLISVAYMQDMTVEGGRVVAYVDYFHISDQGDAKIEANENAEIMEGLVEAQNEFKQFSDVLQAKLKLDSIASAFANGSNCRQAICSAFVKFALQFLLSEPVFKLITKAFILNCFQLDSIPIEYRSVPLPAVNPKLRSSVHKFLNEYYKIVFHLLGTDGALSTMKGLSQPINIYDLIDEKLLVITVQKLVNEELAWNDLEKETQTMVLKFWEEVVQEPCSGLDDFFICDSSTLKGFAVKEIAQAEDNNCDQMSTTKGLVSLNNRFFNNFFPSPTNNTGPDFQENMIFHSENRHWHSYTALEIERHKLDNWELKGHQKYIRFIHQYANSLTGVKGLYNKSIICIEKTKDEKKEKKITSSGSSKKIQAANLKRKDEEQFKKGLDLIKSLRARINTIETLSKKLKEIKSSETKILEMNNEELDMSLHWLRLQVFLDDWMEICNAQKANDENVVGLVEHLGKIFVGCSAIWARLPELCGELNCVCKMLGLKDLFKGQAVEVEDHKTNEGKKEQALKKKKKGTANSQGLEIKEGKLISYNKELTPKLKFKFNKNPELYRISMISSEFQLKYLGAFMNRCNASGKITDPRVPFRPDDWQVELLDIIDRDESALICAPTSSGKTYVAYYAMEKIISQSNDDIVVYVAPTKALVNQVATEIYARFKKEYRGAKSVWGIWTREYRHMPLDCQVLVTVPEMLEILLLSPLHLEWTRRIKRVIFDEIHCMGQLDGGRVWEHLLLMCSMPILCLSATLGSPEEFMKWLKSIQARHSIMVHLVECHFRHSDLTKYIYHWPETKSNTEVTTQARPKGILEMLHPWGSLSVNIVIHSGIPPAAKLSPAECLMVSNFMEKLEIFGSQPLWTKNYFDDSTFILREKVFSYERDLRLFLKDLAKTKSADFEALVGHLNGTLSEKTVRRTPEVLNKEPEFSKDLRSPVMSLALDLREHGMLPAIVFHFSRPGNENMALELTKKLVQIEEAIRDNPNYQNKVSRALEEQEAQEKMRKKKSNKDAARDNKKLGSGEVEDSQPNFDFEKCHPYCTFVGPNNTSTPSEVEEIISRFKYQMPDRLHFLIESMKRGIGVHHAGMPRKYLGAVESLMRSGYLTVVFGTGTLALGINMPCKTAVFLKDNIYLTPSEYQQMSGRAGRRGFDQEGYVVFANIRIGKVNRLMCSELPPLSGHFPLTITLILRMFLLHTQTEDAITVKEGAKSKSRDNELWTKNLKAAEQIVENLIKNSLFCGGSLFGEHQTLNYFRTAVGYLRETNLIASNGHLINFSGLAVHLFFTEPDNLAFVHLFEAGVFHQVCSSLDLEQEVPESTVLEVAHIVCHIFQRILIPVKFVPSFRALAKTSSSNIFLDPLPEALINLLETHNQLVLDIYQNYCNETGIALAPKQCQLPSSGIPIPSIVDQETIKLNSFTKRRLNCRSKLSALTGKGDRFDSFGDMIRNIREDIYLDGSAIPYIKTELVKSGRLNSYLLDFLKNGSLEVIERDNGIKEGHSWDAVRNFQLTLQAILVSMKQRIEAREAADRVDYIADTKVLLCFEKLSETFSKQFERYGGKS